MKRAALFLILAALLLLVPVDPGQAQSDDVAAATLDGGYTLPWWTVDGGGTISSAGEGYTLGGTAGQPDSGVWEGGDYTLDGGFCGGGAPTTVERHVYLPLITRQSPTN